jgi:DNA-binding XRE family transcriptional regulator
VNHPPPHRNELFLEKARMLPVAKVQEVQRLLAETELSYRKIARTAGVSRATVAAIASGKRPDYEARRRERELACQPPGPVVRCPGCGYRVYSPCIACRVRAMCEQEREMARAAPPASVPGVTLASASLYASL